MSDFNKVSIKTKLDVGTVYIQESNNKYIICLGYGRIISEHDIDAMKHKVLTNYSNIDRVMKNYIEKNCKFVYIELATIYLLEDITPKYLDDLIKNTFSKPLDKIHVLAPYTCKCMWTYSVKGYHYDITEREYASIMTSIISNNLELQKYIPLLNYEKDRAKIKQILEDYAIKVKAIYDRYESCVLQEVPEWELEPDNWYIIETNAPARSFVGYVSKDGVYLSNALCFNDVEYFVDIIAELEMRTNALTMHEFVTNDLFELTNFVSIPPLNVEVLLRNDWF